MTSADALLRFHAVRYRWRGDAADSLRVPSFEVRRGERVFVCGPSGCGKSTLLGLAAGVLVAGSGSVAALWDGLASREALAIHDPHHWAHHPSELLQLVRLR